MALVSPPSSPILASRICEALLVDEDTPCEIPIRYGNGRYCNAHGKEYKLLTKAYKEASETVAALKRQAWLHRDAVQALKTTQAAEDAIVLVGVWRDAITVEIRGRETHHKRFFRENRDEGHGQWLESLSREHIKARTLLSDLKLRREVLVVLEERKRMQLEANRRAEAEWRGLSHEHQPSALGNGQTLQGKELPPAARYGVTQPRASYPAVHGVRGGTSYGSGDIYQHQGPTFVPAGGYMRTSTTNKDAPFPSDDGDSNLIACVVTVAVVFFLGTLLRRALLV